MTRAGRLAGVAAIVVLMVVVAGIGVALAPTFMRLPELVGYAVAPAGTEVLSTKEDAKAVSGLVPGGIALIVATFALLATSVAVALRWPVPATPSPAP